MDINDTIHSSGIQSERLAAADLSPAVQSITYIPSQDATISELIETLKRVERRYGDIRVILDTGTAIANVYPEVHIVKTHDGTPHALVMAMTVEDRERLDECRKARGY